MPVKLLKRGARREWKRLNDRGLGGSRKRGNPVGWLRGASEAAVTRIGVADYLGLWKAQGNNSGEP